MTTNRPLRVFICHSSQDKPAVRELYQKLRNEPWIQPWLDEEELFPGMDWNMEIEKAIEATDVILVCLSNNSITKEGYVQREIRIALDYADYKPEGTLFIIPVRLEECTPPKRLARWQYADYFEGQHTKAFQRLLASLRKRSVQLGLVFDDNRSSEVISSYLAETNGNEQKLPIRNESKTQEKKTVERKNLHQKDTERIGKKSAKKKPKSSDKIFLPIGMEFMYIPAGEFLMGSNKVKNEKPQHKVVISYDFWMS